MTLHEKHSAYRVVVLIVNPKLSERATKIFNENNVPMHYALHGEGTVSSEMMDILGMVSAEKHILIGILPKGFADEIMRTLRKELKLGIPDSGIVFSFGVSGANALLLRMLQPLENDEKTVERKDETTVSDMKYALVAAIVNQGGSEAVMDAARTAGATGGTVLRSRRIGDIAAVWGLSVQEERDIVLIVAPTDKKLDIMQAIGEKCGVHSETKGIVISVPLDNVLGLDEYN